MSNQNSQEGKSNSIFATIIIPICFAVAYCIFIFLLGSKGNFEGGDPEKGHPLNILGTIYKGGIAIVPILIAVDLMIIVFSIERVLTLMKASGSGNTDTFVRKVKSLLSSGQVDSAIAECDKQKGSLASVVRAGLSKYKLVSADSNLKKEEKVAAIQKDLEEATSLELPMLSKNLVILSTCASIATLLGLIGTVLGMIRSFSALANAGAPDTSALATGISEALINTFLGIAGSCVAIVMYNFFSNKIDGMTYGMDEAGYSIAQTFNEKGN
jgi:biopolymer transport protein ExbB